MGASTQMADSDHCNVRSLRISGRIKRRLSLMTLLENVVLKRFGSKSCFLRHFFLNDGRSS